MKKKIFLILSIFSILLSGTVIVSAESGKSGFLEGGQGRTDVLAG